MTAIPVRWKIFEALRYECGRELVEESDQYRGLLSSFTVYIMPSMNPDGFEVRQHLGFVKQRNDFPLF